MLKLIADEMWGPILTLWEWSVGKSFIQQQMEYGIPRSDSLIISLFGRMVLNELLKSTNRCLLLWVGQSVVESQRYSVLHGPVSSVSELLRVKPGQEIGGDVVLDEFLKALCDDRCECYWVVIL